MFEYDGKTSDSIGPASIRLTCAIWVVLLAIESALSVLFLYDIFVSHAAYRLEARAHSKIELLALCSQSISTFSHFYLHESEHLIHYALCLLSSAATSLAYVYFLPFYNLFTTFVNAMVYAVFAWSAFALILGDMLSNATCGFLLTILVPFVMPMLLWNLLERRCEYIRSTYLSNFVHLRTVYQCELCIRFAAMDFKNSKSPNRTAWVQFYKETQSELFNRLTARFVDNMRAGIWEFAFIFGTLKDESLARIKLSKTSNCAFDLESVFNQYRFMQLLAGSEEDKNEEVEYVNFRLLYDKAKKADEESCMLQLDFWTELSAERPSTTKIETLARRVNLSISHAKDLFSQLIQLFPKSHLALKLYGTYLCDVLNDTEKGRELVNRSLFEENELQSKSLLMENRFSYFDDSNGIMLLSGNSESVGSIVYINTEAANILGTTSRLALGMNIASFLPQTIISQQSHDFAMRRFLQFSTSNDVGLPFTLFVVDMAGFLVEVHIQVKCMSLDLRQFYIAALKRITAPREVCVFDKEFLIKTHTKSFPYLVGFSDQLVLYANMKIEQMVGNFDLLHQENALNSVFEYMIPGTVNTIAMRFSDLIFRGRVLHLLYCTQDADERKKWCSDADKDSAANFQELMHSDKPNATVASVDLKEEVKEGNGTGLKSVLRKSKEKKGLEVKFDLIPVFFELPDTDFKAGRRVIGKMKDAAPLDPKQSKSISFSKESNPKESEGDDKIYDLKDLRDFSLQGPEEDLDGDVQSKISLALISLKGQETEKKGSKSVASSAVSSNSSFTSSATAVQLLKIVQSSMTRFKCSFLVTNLVVVGTVLAMVIYLAVASAEYEDTLIIKELSIQRTMCSTFATVSRDLMLIHDKVMEDTDLAVYYSFMTASLVTFNEILDLQMDRVEDFSSTQYRKLYMEAVVPTWELAAGMTVYVQDSMLNVLRKISTYATTILTSPLSTLNSTHPGIYYLTRNGQGETLKVLNESVWYFISGEQENLKSTLSVIGGLGVLAMVLMLACFVVVMLPTVIQVDRSNQNVWTFFYRLPLDIIQDLKFRREERIEMVHGIEQDQKQGEMQHFKSMKNRLQIKCSRKWPYVFSRIWIYYLFTIAYAIYFYYDVYDNLSHLLASKPERLNFLGERDLEVVTAYYWLQEALLAGTSLSLTQIQAASKFSPSAYWELDKSISHLEVLENRLSIERGRELGMTSNSTSLSFDSACTDTDLGCYSMVLVRGIHSAISAYTQDLHFLSTSGQTPTSPEVLRARNTVSRLQTLTYATVSSADTQIGEDIQAVRLRVELITTAYCVLSILFYLVVYLPMANKVRKQLTDIWDLAGLIPIDLLERIKRALKLNEAPK